VLALSDVGPPTPGEKPKPRNLRFAPVLDHYVLTADPDSPAARPLSQVPLMTGFNADEGYIFGAAAMTSAEFEAQVRGRYGAAAPRFLDLYPHATNGEATSSAKLIARDRYMASLLLWLRGRAHEAQAGIYPYLFEHPFPGPDRDRFGSFHTAEVPYVFGVLDQGGRPFTGDDRSISAQLADYWLNFIRGGNPNGMGLTRWAPATPDQVEVMGLGDQVGMRPAVSTRERLAAFRMYVAGGGRLSLF
jgi:para-nitrobenzyl esterase